MSGCLLGIIREDLSRFGYISDKLALQVRIIAMVLVQSICETNKKLWPPSSLHLASYYNCFEMLEIMLKVFDYDETMSFDGATPAQFAVVRGHLRALTVLNRNVNTSLYSCFTGLNAYELLKNFLKHAGSDKLPSISRIYACGDSYNLSLGIMPGNYSTNPVPVQFFNDDGLGKEVKQVSFARHHAIYLINGQAYSCGLGKYGKLGHGDEMDQLKLRAVKFFEPVVCVAAGLTHSIICTRKKIVVFGLNHKGQIGLGTREYVLTPTVAKTFKESREYIINCSTTNLRSVVITNYFNIYVTGAVSSCVWQKYSSNTFRLIRDSHNQRATSAFVRDSCIVRVYARHDLSKITIKTENKNYYITSAIHITRCIGIFYAPHLNVLFSGYKCFYENRRQTVKSGIFLFDSQCLGLLQSVYFYNDLMKESIVEVASADITVHGQIVIVDYLGDVYEGIMGIYSTCTNPNCARAYNITPSWVVGYTVNVKVNRLCGILPAKNVFLTPDGRNKILNFCEMDSQAIFHNENNVSKVEHPSRYVATVICSKEGSAVERYETSLEVLKHESPVLSAYFERWAGEKKEIRITAEPTIVKTFLDYCCKHHLRSNFSMQELMELLIFADELMCQNFLDAVMKEMFKPPFEMWKFRDLFGLARYLSSVELYKNLSKLCAAIFPTLLENGFINELSFHEIAYIESAFRSYCLDSVVFDVNEYESEVETLEIPEEIVRNIIEDVMTVITEPMDIGELIDFCKRIETDSLSEEGGSEVMSENVVNGTVNDNRGCQEASLANETNGDPTSEKNDDAINLGNENDCDQTPNVLTEISIATSHVCEKNLEPKNLGVESISFNEETHLSHVPEERTPEQEREEQAMAELTEHYEGEDTVEDVSVTVCAEREVEKGNGLF
ncbi:unnamed protein product [Litomosoides sigmodontis]|uniref:BTB domain-containing protein n=1 Tax=Litomosoides sigmodontis TaxID=42156 RepID=A0A3P6TFM0_LITSI|nr:unnamed protein product [Litomosoides sigmodontis]